MSASVSELPRREVTLDNGLRVVLVQRAAVHRAVASLYLRVGSRFETKADNGVSHFLEHMLFRGTSTLASAHEEALAFERLGGTLFAATHVDHGLMSVSVPPHNLDPVLRLLGEVTTSPRFTAIEIERGIVHEEILEELDDEGRMIDADNLVRQVMYGEHPLGLTITGGLDTLARFDEPMLRAHHQKHYTGANAVLCLAGRIGDEDACLKTIEEAFRAMPRGELAPIGPAPNGKKKKAQFRFVEAQASQTDLRIGFHAPCESDPREPATEMLLRVLDDGMSTRLYETICDRLGLCYDVSGMFETYEDDGVVDLAAGTAHERTTTVARELLSLVRTIAEEGPREEELEKARNRHLWAVDALLDDPDEIAGFFGLSTLANIARTPAERHAELAAVTKSDVRDAAEKIFRPENMSVVAVGLLSAAERKKLEKLVGGF